MPVAGIADLFPRVVVCAGYKKIPLPVKGEELFVLYGLCAEVIVEDILRRYAETVEHLQNRSRHHRRSAHEVDTSLGILVVLEVVLVEDGVYESGFVGNTCSIGCGIGTVQSQVEREVGELLLYLVEILEIEGLLERTGTVPERCLLYTSPSPRDCS